LSKKIRQRHGLLLAAPGERNIKPRNGVHQLDQRLKEWGVDVCLDQLKINYWKKWEILVVRLCLFWFRIGVPVCVCVCAWVCVWHCLSLAKQSFENWEVCGEAYWRLPNQVCEHYPAHWENSEPFLTECASPTSLVEHFLRVYGHRKVNRLKLNCPRENWRKTQIALQW
jgi:hypothetical protein